jgi:hypothetical protein
MSLTKPSRLYRSRPWFAESRLRKTPAQRYKREVGRRIFGLVTPVAFLPLAFATGANILLVVPGTGIGLVHSAYHLRQLKKHPEHFHEKDAATRTLLDDFRSSLAAGTWNGPRYRPLWLYTAPLGAAFIGLQFPALLHTSVATGIVVGLVALVALVGVNMFRGRSEIGNATSAMPAPTI